MKAAAARPASDYDGLLTKYHFAKIPSRPDTRNSEHLFNYRMQLLQKMDNVWTDPL